MTFTSDSSAAMKHIEDLGPEFRAEEMEVVDKVNGGVQEEEMDHGVELEEGQQVGGDDEDELEEGEIIDSDAEPGGEVTEVEEEEEMDHGGQSTEEDASMDAEKLEEGQQVGEDDKDELEEGEIADSDTEPGGEVTEVEEEEDDNRGYMGCGQPSDSEETVYPLSSEESSKSRVSFAKSLTHSLEEAAVIGGNGTSLKYPEVEE